MSIRYAVTLKKDLSDVIAQGHPWIYREALLPHTPYENGTIVSVFGVNSKYIGQGVYDASSPIAVRIYSQDSNEQLHSSWATQKLIQCIKRRLGFIQQESTNAFRLCHGEGDFLPGLVIDRYHHTVVVQFDGLGAKQYWQPIIKTCLQHAFEELRLPIECIYIKERHGEQGSSVPQQEPFKEIETLEHGVRFLVNVVHGQKTGFFLDQRENRLLIRSIAKQRKVWNGFCYTGGFSVQAALGGAQKVVSVDSAAAAIETAKRNFTINGMSPVSHDFFTQDVFLHLRQAIAGRITYDLVIADPPSFAPNQDSVPRALRAYRELFSQCMKIVAPGGILAASSCSSHVSQEPFLHMLGQAAFDNQRKMQFLEIRGQPADHPVLPAFPEGRYLKFVLCQLD